MLHGLVGVLTDPDGNGHLEQIENWLINLQSAQHQHIYVSGSKARIPKVLDVPTNSTGWAKYSQDIAA